MANAACWERGLVTGSASPLGNALSNAVDRLEEEKQGCNKLSYFHSVPFAEFCSSHQALDKLGHHALATVWLCPPYLSVATLNRPYDSRFWYETHIYTLEVYEHNVPPLIASYLIALDPQR